MESKFSIKRQLKLIDRQISNSSETCRYVLVYFLTNHRFFSSQSIQRLDYQAVRSQPSRKLRDHGVTLAKWIAVLVHKRCTIAVCLRSPDLLPTQSKALIKLSSVSHLFIKRRNIGKENIMIISVCLSLQVFTSICNNKPKATKRILLLHNIPQERDARVTSPTYFKCINK